MEAYAPYLAGVAGAVLGAFFVWLWLRAAGEKRAAGAAGELADARARLDSTKERLAELRDGRVPKLEAESREKDERLIEFGRENAELTTRIEEERKAAAEKLALVDDAQKKLGDAFSALSKEALKSNNEMFLDLARTKLLEFQEGARTDLDARRSAIDAMVGPLGETLEKIRTDLGSVEKERVDAYAHLTEQVAQLSRTESDLKRETDNLVRALRSPEVRGSWGELTLKRVVEFAGMVKHCHFVEQESVRTEGGRLRPDMIVKLPGGRDIVVDSKTPLQAYLEAVEAPDDRARQEKLKEHARHVRQHLAQLGQKAYWEQFDSSPEFVVMFLPGEAFFSAALQQDPGLIEFGVKNRVIPATPTTLIALLKAAHYGWRQEQVAENAQKISELGRALYDRIRTVAGHLEDLRKGLDRAVGSYNKAVKSFDTRLVVTARKFDELGASTGDKIESPEAIDRSPVALPETSLPPRRQEHQERPESANGHIAERLYFSDRGILRELQQQRL